MTNEEIYNSIVYYIKEDIGFPYHYDELSVEQECFVDVFVENYEADIENVISDLELTVSDLERDLAVAEIECRKLKKEIYELEGQSD